MKKLNWVSFLFILTLPLSGQRNADYGVSGGTTSYLGDINPNRLMYAPLPSASVFYRYNFNPRQALRGNILVGGIRGNDLDFKNDFQQNRSASFSEMIGEATIQYEFNFFPYSTIGKLNDYSPYLAAGAGVAFNAGSSAAVTPVIPFSIGLKFNILKNLGLEAEYGFRKTFYDNFDGLKDFVASSDYSLIHNNDWYTYTGVSVTWKIMGKLAGCPVYDDVDPKRRR